MEIDTSRYREGLPQVGYEPYRQIHAHSTGNKNSTAQNEADYHMRRPVNSGFFSHVVGNGRVMQVGPVNQGAYDVGGGWNAETYAAVELIESHSTREEFMQDYRLYIQLLRELADEAGLPKTLDGLKAIFLYPLLGVFITGLFMSVIVSPMAGINQSLMEFLKGFQDSNPVLLGLVIGCMCAFDMGGPVNKAAYVTGTVLLGEGNTAFMAGVSAACIAPPLITTVAVLLFKNRFDTNERNAGLVNFILGSTHITEGAIPFVAKDPLRAMPSMMLGSSIAAILTYLFGVQVPAPHGGFLVLPVVTHPFLWVLAIAIGSVVGGVVLGATRKPLSE